REHAQTGGGTEGFAMCACGLTVNGPTGEAADAVLRGHRQTVTARLVDSIDATYAASVADTR
ncbi:hypothetical protein ABT317_22335, partial [Streptomyces carpinensis]